MKKAIGIASLAALMTVGIAQTTLAQTNTQTNLVLDLDIRLTAVSAGSVSTNHGVVMDGVDFTKITSRGIIQELGAATSNSFSEDAKLVLVTPTNSLANWTVEVRDGTNSFDVTGFFGHTAGTNVVTSTFMNTNNGASGTTDYSIDSFSLHDAAGSAPLTTHFTVSGFTVAKMRGVLGEAGGVLGETGSIVANVSGTGDDGGKPIVTEGSIFAHGNNVGGGEGDFGFERDH
jgi:hypothetical protein